MRVPSLERTGLLACILYADQFYRVAGFSPSSHVKKESNFINNEIRPRTKIGSTAVVVNGSAEKVDQETLAPPEIRLNVPEKARTVTSVCTSGTLCTQSYMDDIEGAPFGSFVDYVLDDNGNPVLLMNEMSMHTVNIQKAGEGVLVTLFAQLGGPTSSGQPAHGQDVSRCSITGTIAKIEPTAEDWDVIRMRYGIAHTYADQVMDSPKFHFYRLVPTKIYFVGGFGVSSEWVPPEEYTAATPDILAKESSRIMGRLNRDHAEDLLLTATEILDVNEVEKVRVTGVDRLGMDMRVTSRVPRRKNKLLTDEFRVGFRIPVISVEDAKSEILKVFQEAWEKKNGVTWGDDEIPGADVPVLKTAEDNLM
ncbi:hypothetical protein THAOC_18545 [Thalassiosira oceanica]|uniref:Uncharacterized protein n=1 Tax=Thalassiosira oceanica TaxID=159749 RepID=K0SJ34_THAOC|nr:hypothetical protein THAOC_18545 [Thalassiosira oceanica]|mmetsp:Transcript_20860/g.49012  ORF Transcript_20860/g.49012 Transcript_20860/m.49012 type:complete len:365 (-) Transcript_20860:103-1197(-)|eukprot:EJK61026.1 hypothetical protein THAOC_18545 [Thalassiosira oceanica]